MLLGLGGAAIGWSLSKMNWLESVRGGVAGWALLVFGLAYSLWGLAKARSHRHFDIYEDGRVYVYQHKHGEMVPPAEKHAVTPSVLFIIFLLGPCEPMIPLLYLPGAKNSLPGMLLLIAIYTICTLATMMLMVVSGFYGFSFLQTWKLDRYVHAVGACLSLFAGQGWFLWVGNQLKSEPVYQPGCSEQHCSCAT